MVLIRIILFQLILSFLNLYAEESFPQIYDSATWQPIEFEDIKEKLNSVDVLIIGEEHDDKHGHQEKLRLIKFLTDNFKITISMEMFERDQQLILDEYLEGNIDEKLFRSDCRLWNNYEDYKPIVLFAKENKVAIIAANAPKRYVRSLSRNGLAALKSFSTSSKSFLAPLYMIEIFRQEPYEDKILDSIKGHGGDNQGFQKMILAQNLWDATMTDSIIKKNESEKTKIIHINGRFHSDEYLGVTYRLKKLAVKVLTISMIKKTNKEIPEKETYKKFADIIYFTRPSITDKPK